MNGVIEKILGLKIRVARQRAGMTQEEQVLRVLRGRHINCFTVLRGRHIVLRVLRGRHINCIIAIREARNRIDMDSPPSRKSLRPPRPVAVNPLRGPSTSLRPCRECCAFSRDDRAGSTRQVCFHDLCCADPARRASLRSKVHGGQRPGPRAGVKVCEPIARRRTGVLSNALWRATRAARYTDDCYAIA